jgi:hypothetical protein
MLPPDEPKLGLTPPEWVEPPPIPPLHLHDVPGIPSLRELAALLGRHEALRNERDEARRDRHELETKYDAEQAAMDAAILAGEPTDELPWTEGAERELHRDFHRRRFVAATRALDYWCYTEAEERMRDLAPDIRRALEAWKSGVRAHLEVVLTYANLVDELMHKVDDGIKWTRNWELGSNQQAWDAIMGLPAHGRPVGASGNAPVNQPLIPDDLTPSAPPVELNGVRAYTRETGLDPRLEGEG